MPRRHEPAGPVPERVRDRPLGSGALRGLVGAGPSQVGIVGALRARDVSRPTAEDVARALAKPEPTGAAGTLHAGPQEAAAQARAPQAPAPQGPRLREPQSRATLARRQSPRSG